MHQFQCGRCGYDMTGIERLANSVDSTMFSHLNGIMPMGMGGFYNSALDNSVRCPNCGTIGNWLRG